jgi:penicillin-binding protein 2
MEMKRFRPGVSFGDFVISDMKVVRSRVKEESTRDYRRGWLVWLFILVAFGVLFVRLAELQIFKAGVYGILSDQNRIKKIKIVAPRGEIVDRNGEKLAYVIHKTEKREDGLEVETWEREYPLGSAAAHLVGYLGEIGENEVGLLKAAGQKYEGGDLVGRMGLELAFEEYLRGVDGGRLVEVDSAGKPVRELGKKMPVAGPKLQTTIDIRIQKSAWEALGGKKGAVVVSNPKTGEILAMVSSPGFEPNMFVKRSEANAREITRILNSSDLPMFDRSIGGVYPPGSTFKMVTTVAALESEKIKKDFRYTDVGVVEVGPYRYTNWLFTKSGGVEGNIGFERAITRSTDTFFYVVGGEMGVGAIDEWAKKFGFGEKSGIVLPGEVEGLVPSPDWKEKVKGEAWFLGNTYHLAIGQGDLLATPLQVNIMTATLANNGNKCQPKMAKMDGGRCQSLDISSEVLDVVKRGMVGACSPGGTAFPIFDWNEAAEAGLTKGSFTGSRVGKVLPVVACKTGTAEYVAGDGKVRTHGWLTAFAPVDDPQIAVTTVVEGGGEGSNVAAPIVRKIMANYFDVEDKYPYSAIRSGIGE